MAVVGKSILDRGREARLLVGGEAVLSPEERARFEVLVEQLRGGSSRGLVSEGDDESATGEVEDDFLIVEVRNV